MLFIILISDAARKWCDTHCFAYQIPIEQAMDQWRTNDNISGIVSLHLTGIQNDRNAVSLRAHLFTYYICLHICTCRCVYVQAHWPLPMHLDKGEISLPPPPPLLTISYVITILNRFWWAAVYGALSYQCTILPFYPNAGTIIIIEELKWMRPESVAIECRVDWMKIRYTIKCSHHVLSLSLWTQCTWMQ